MALVRYAKSVVVSEIRGGPPPAQVVGGRPQGVFVTIENGGKVLGCRGTLSPRKASLSDEIAAAARAAAAHDPRYRPLREKDLDGALVTVTVVNRLEPISDVGNLKPEDGLVLTSGGKKGVVLPWEGKDPTIRLTWAYRKAGVPAGSSAQLERMVAERWRG